MWTTPLLAPRAIGALAVALALTACGDPAETTDPTYPAAPASVMLWSGNPELTQALAALRDATDQFHDVAVAFAAGYRPSSAGCESSDEGAMGIHYGHPALLGLVRGAPKPTGTDAVIDPLRPEVIMYEPQPDGSRRLVGVEFVVYRAAWDAAHPGQPPTLLGIPFDEKFDEDAHGHEDHYELHVWLWRHNPLGLFAPWNPKVSCL